MFTRKTVFVLGAGTSFEIGFPVGSGLRDRLTGVLNIKFANGYEQSSGDRKIVEALQRHARTDDGRRGDINPYLHASWQICEGLPLAISIDNYLEAHAGNPEVELMGKLGIARAILEAEAASPLMINQSRPQVDHQAVARTWYGGFARALTVGVAKHQIDTLFENVSVITFNYDRSFEQFLAHALAAYYQEPVERTQALVAGARIFHPYGMVGKLPWQVQVRAGGVPYGGGGMNLIDIAKQIKTFTESLGGEVPIDQIHAALREADQVIFLGFAFHKQNLDLLTPKEAMPRKARRLFGTAYGISSSDVDIIRADIRQVFRTRNDPDFSATELEAVPLRCADFMDGYHRSITG